MNQAHQTLRYLLCFALFTLTSSCNHMVLSTKGQFTRLTFKDPPILGQSVAGQEVKLGGFSGLYFLGKTENGHYEFVTLTDRGPNADQYNGNRPFLLPDYSPRLVFFSVDDKFKKVTIQRMLILRTKDGPISGLPNKKGPEDPVDVFDYFLRYDPDGIDSEAVAVDENGHYWIGEEYAPSILEFDKEGVLIKRYFPGKDFQELFANRRSNRGFEGLAIYNNQVWAFLQSPLKAGPQDMKGPVLVFDLKTKKALPPRYYPFDTSKADRIGDATTNKDGILVLERDEKTKKKSLKKVYLVKDNPETMVLEKKLLVDLSAIGLYEVEKLEGMALVDNRYLFLVNDNDFGLRGRPDYLKSGLVPTKTEESYLYIIDLNALKNPDADSSK